ncbi:hypothetical protein KVH15_33580 [Streptomyces olivaceus]|uniref:hypothetical protein n=1 Tax=Streptomyces olivaceus TaxID=47716 RepID=UPI001CCE7B96|nr:hypothetical protein [Streptomyces olivaceus]MBZ6085917.1 hypothetical protein [Streptomyces olivaceus]GHI91742.1 hypothetical protein TPA0905_12130 [Streptomyces olivaceus]
MPLLYPGPRESLSDLVLGLWPSLSPRVRAGVRVVTGGERAGLAVPEYATPATTVPPAEPTPAPAPPKSPRRQAARRRTTTSKEN